ncbi:MAG: hypothetical protein MRY57_02990 [Candidatus Pacebacteria bacterium]|nr:hypothetical protein [Candidatus Paceibacterota bacterium]
MKNLFQTFVVLFIAVFGLTSCEPEEVIVTETEIVEIETPGDTIFVLQEVPTSISSNQLFEGNENTMSFDMRFTLPETMILHDIVVHRKMSTNTNLPIEDIYQNILLYINNGTNFASGSHFTNLEPSNNGFMKTTLDIDSAVISADQEYLFRFTESLNFIDEIEGDVVATNYIELILEQEDGEVVMLRSSQFTQLIEQYEYVEFIINDDGGNFDFYTFPNNNGDEERFVRAEIDYDGADNEVTSIEVNFNVTNIQNSNFDLSTLFSEAYLEIDDEDFDIDFPSIQTTSGSMIATIVFDEIDDVNLSDGTFDFRLELEVEEYTPNHPLAGISLQLESIVLSGETEYGEPFSENLTTDFSPSVYIGNDHFIVEDFDEGNWNNNGSFFEKQDELSLENNGSDDGEITNGSDGFLFELNGQTLTTSQVNNISGYAIAITDEDDLNFYLGEGEENDYRIDYVVPVGSDFPEFIGTLWDDEDGYSGITYLSEFE